MCQHLYKSWIIHNAYNLLSIHYISLSLICMRLYTPTVCSYTFKFKHLNFKLGTCWWLCNYHNHRARDTSSNQGVSLHQLQSINHLYVPFAKSSCCPPCSSLNTNLQDNIGHCSFNPSLHEQLFMNPPNKVTPPYKVYSPHKVPLIKGSLNQHFTSIVWSCPYDASACLSPYWCSSPCHVKVPMALGLC